MILAIAIPAGVRHRVGHVGGATLPRRRPRPTRVPFELGCFTLAAVALIAAGATVAGIVFAVVAAINAVLLAAFGQLEA